MNNNNNNNNNNQNTQVVSNNFVIPLTTNGNGVKAFYNSKLAAS
jgi:hypothetical protein